jgi:hypothetical protein
LEGSSQFGVSARRFTYAPSGPGGPDFLDADNGRFDRSTVFLSRREPSRAATVPPGSTLRFDEHRWDVFMVEANRYHQRHWGGAKEPNVGVDDPPPLRSSAEAYMFCGGGGEERGRKELGGSRRDGTAGLRGRTGRCVPQTECSRAGGVVPVRKEACLLSRKRGSSGVTGPLTPCTTNAMYVVRVGLSDRLFPRQPRLLIPFIRGLPAEAM